MFPSIFLFVETVFLETSVVPLLYCIDVVTDERWSQYVAQWLAHMHQLLAEMESSDERAHSPPEQCQSDKERRQPCDFVVVLPVAGVATPRQSAVRSAPVAIAS